MAKQIQFYIFDVNGEPFGLSERALASGGMTAERLAEIKPNVATETMTVRTPFTHGDNLAVERACTVMENGVLVRKSDMIVGALCERMVESWTFKQSPSAEGFALMPIGIAQAIAAELNVLAYPSILDDPAFSDALKKQ